MAGVVMIPPQIKKQRPWHWKWGLVFVNLRSLEKQGGLHPITILSARYDKSRCQWKRKLPMVETLANESEWIHILVTMSLQLGFNGNYHTLILTRERRSKEKVNKKYHLSTNKKTKSLKILCLLWLMKSGLTTWPPMRTLLNGKILLTSQAT